MQIFRELAGYSLGRADIVRRAMSKKKHDVLEKEREIFIHGLKREDGSYEIDGCVNRGVDEKMAEVIFGEIESFASYAFNKSHAAAYATVSYQTAYLKCHYTCAYMAALLSSVLGYAPKVAEYMEECTRLGIAVLPPHVNESERGFTVSGKDIRYGLLAIKNLGRGVIDRLVQERKTDGAYTSFYSFCKRMQGKDLNKRAIESLVKCGALDGLGNNRREMLLSVEKALDSLDMSGRRNIEGQVGFFDGPGAAEAGEPDIAEAEDFTHMQKLTLEKEVTGMYLSGHPMMQYKEVYDSKKVARIDRIFASSDGESNEYRDNQRVTLFGMVMSVKTKLTKTNATMAFLDLEDMYGSMEVLAFPSTYDRFEGLLREGAALAVSGRISFTEEKEPKLLCDEIQDPDSVTGVESESQFGGAPSRPFEKRGRPGLYLKVRSEEDRLYKKALQYIAVFDGSADVYVRFADTGKMLRAPKSYRVSMNPVLNEALQKLLGSENVAYIR